MRLYAGLLSYADKSPAEATARSVLFVNSPIRLHRAIRPYLSKGLCGVLSTLYLPYQVEYNPRLVVLGNLNRLLITTKLYGRETCESRLYFQ